MMVLEWYASDFGPDVNVADVVNDVWSGAAGIWPGAVVQSRSTEGVPTFHFLAWVAGERIVCEAVSTAILGDDGSVRLVTAVLESVREPRIGESLHRAIHDHLKAQPAKPLTGQAAKEAMAERLEKLVRFEYEDALL